METSTSSLATSFFGVVEGEISSILHRCENLDDRFLFLKHGSVRVMLHLGKIKALKLIHHTFLKRKATTAINLKYKAFWTIWKSLSCNISKKIFSYYSSNFIIEFDYISWCVVGLFKVTILVQ